LNTNIFHAKSLLAFSFLFFVALPSRSQTLPHQGYYITVTGDTILCKIKFKDWRINPGTISLIVGKN